MAYVAWSVVFGEQPTAAKWNILGTNDASFNDGTGIGDNAIIHRHIGGSKMVVQMIATNFSSAATGTGLIPSDDTIPQNTEGNEFMTQAYTPKSATNRLFIEVKFQGTISSAPGDLTTALFQDSTANAIAVAHAVVPTAGYMAVNLIGLDMVAGTTSAITFKVRAGSAAAATTTFNGSGGVRRYGGIPFSYIKITEYKP